MKITNYIGILGASLIGLASPAYAQSNEIDSINNEIRATQEILASGRSGLGLPQIQRDLDSLTTRRDSLIATESNSPIIEEISGNLQAVSQTPSQDATLDTPRRTFNLQENGLKSREVLVNWDRETGRAYTGKGIPVMSKSDTLEVSEAVKGNYAIEIYDAPNGVNVEERKIITTSDVQDGIINAALVHRNEKGEVDESVRLLVPVFDGVTQEDLSELERTLAKRDSTILAQETQLPTTQEETPRARYFGIEAGYGSNKETVVGVSARRSLNKNIGIEGFVQGYLSGNPVSESQSREVTLRERLLVGPGTYKQRTDETSYEEERTAGAGAGIGFSYEVISNQKAQLELFARSGAVLSEVDSETEGTATITHERNDEQLKAPQVLSNKKYGKKKGIDPSLELGVRYNTEEGVYVGTSINRVGDANSVRINLGYKF